MADQPRDGDKEETNFERGPFVDGRRPVGTLTTIARGVKKVLRSLVRRGPKSAADPPDDLPEAEAGAEEGDSAAPTAKSATSEILVSAAVLGQACGGFGAGAG